MKEMWSGVVIGLTLIASISFGEEDNDEPGADRDEERLYKFLFDKYNPTIRPVLKKTDTVRVKLGITLHQLIEVEYKNQVMKTSIWIRQSWHNPYLKWNYSHFGGIRTINVDQKKIWKPDVYLYNNVDDGDDGSMDRFHTNLVVSHAGHVMWLAPKIVKTSCKFDVGYFPFDEQFCDLKFGSWTYDGFRLDIVPENPRKCEGDAKKFVKNGEWELIGVPCKRNELVYICCPEPYPDLTFTVHLRRKYMFYFVNMIAPCFLITALTVLSFYLPPESGERLTLVITNLLALTVFILLVAETIPPTSETVPLVSIFFYGSFFEVSLALIATCVVLRCNFDNPAHTPIPTWIRIFVLGWMAKVLRIRIPVPEVKVIDKEDSTKPASSSIQIQHEGVTYRKIQNHTVNRTRPSSTEIEKGKMLGKTGDNVPARQSLLLRPTAENPSLRHSSPTIFSFFGSDGNSMFNHGPSISNLERASMTHSCLHVTRNNSEHRGIDSHDDHVGRDILAAQTRLANDVRELVKFKLGIEHEEDLKNEWRLIAVIVDKFFLWLFLLILSITTIIVFMQAPIYSLKPGGDHDSG